jgi:integrase
MLEKFKAYLKGSVKVSERSAVNYLITVRTIYNKAISAGIVDQASYPFGKGGISCKRPEGEKIGLDVDEVKKMENIDLSKHSYLDHARNVWLFSFYFAGMRAGDVLTLTRDKIKGDRLYYTTLSYFSSLKP